MAAGEEILSSPALDHLKTVTPEMDRINAWVLTLSYVLIFFAAPVFYTGIVQATLCNRLGTSATIANLPLAVALLGNLAPFFLSWRVPYRLERAVLVWSFVMIAASCGFTATALLLPFGKSVRVAAVIAQALVQGLAGSAQNVFTFQCIGRGTTLAGRARAYKWAFSSSPGAAVVGSLGAQFVLNHGVSWLAYPKDFALIYAVGVPCGLGVALLSTRYRLVSVPEERRPAFFSYVARSVSDYVRVRPLVILFLIYMLWYSALAVMPNLSLYTNHALNRNPNQLAGLMLAIRFGGKALAGYALGVILLRWGIRAPVAVTVSLFAVAALWPFVASGSIYLAVFAVMGGAELGGNYIPNYVLTISPPEVGARNLGLLTLATPMAALASVLHGALADWMGFQASFLFALAAAATALWLVFKLPALADPAA